ncbi:MAG: hypothetical protein WCS01_12640 [bacterium]
MKQSRAFEKAIVVVAGLMFAAGTSLAQVANPADAMRNAAPSPSPQPAEQRYRTWEYPVIQVTATRLHPLREESLIGSYEQPLWTATRRFPTTRVYVVPEGKMEVEYWLRTTFNKDGTTSYRSLYEVEFGLPHRFQLDIYSRTDQSGKDGEIYQSEQLELRYALADWGNLPGNHTLYLEWIRHDQRDEPDQIEPKILFGGELAQRWHWGVNFVAECQTGGDLEREYQFCSGLSYAVRDYKLALGAECKAAFTDTKEDRGNFENSVLLGPSLQYRPFPQMTMNFAPLFGMTSDSPDAQVWFNTGWEF